MAWTEYLVRPYVCTTMSISALLRNLTVRFYQISHVESHYGVDVHCQQFFVDSAHLHQLSTP